MTTKPTHKEITDAYRRLAKGKSGFYLALIYIETFDLLCEIQNAKLN